MTEERQAPKVNKAPREKPAYALLPAIVSRVHQVNKAPLGQPVLGACLESREKGDPWVLRVIKVTWAYLATLGWTARRVIKVCRGYVSAQMGKTALMGQQEQRGIKGIKVTLAPGVHRVLWG